MTVNPFIPIADIPPRNQYTASGSQTTFIYGFPIFSSSDLTVIETVISGGVETDFTRSVGAGTDDFSVTGVNSDTGGTIVFNSARTNGNRITIYRNVAYARLTDYKVSGGFSAARINLELDQLQMQIQQLREADKLAVSVAASDVTVSAVLPNAAARANKIAAYDGTGKPTVVTGDALSPTQNLVNMTITGQLLVGINTVIEGSYTGLFPASQNIGATGTSSTANFSAFMNFRRSNDASGPRNILQKSRNGAVNTHGIVQNGDILGTHAFVGDDGVGYVAGAFIIAKVDGTPGVNDMPGRLEFHTTQDGAATPTLALTIDKSQKATFAGAVEVAGTLTNNGVAVTNQNNSLCDGRLTLTTGTPVTTSDVTAAGTVYFTPYKGNRIALSLGSSNWVIRTFSELSISLASGYSSGKPYDVFAYDNSGVVAVETLVWTNDTTRATALALVNGVYVKSGDETRRYIGTFYTTGAATTEDSKAKRYVWNYYNRVKRPMERIEATVSWTYSTASNRQANGSTANQLEMVIGVSEDAVRAEVVSQVYTSTATLRNCAAMIGVDSTTTASGLQVSTAAQNGVNCSINVGFDQLVAAGRHYLAWLERGGGADTQTWTGNNTCGITGSILG